MHILVTFEVWQIIFGKQSELDEVTRMVNKRPEPAGAAISPRYSVTRSPYQMCLLDLIFPIPKM